MSLTPLRHWCSVQRAFLRSDVCILIEDSFMDTLLHTRLPCGITSVARRQGQDERAPITPLHTLRGLDLPCSLKK